MRPGSHPVRSLALVAAVILAPGPARAGPLEAVVTVPDLASLLRDVGGEEVSVETLTKGPQDPHYVEPRPSFIRRLHDADLFAQVGMDLEIGWAPVLLQSARNPAVLPGAPGHLDASEGIEALEIPGSGADRAQGDIHPYGNPHYLTDPMNGLRVAAQIRDKLIELRPERADAVRTRYQAFARRLLAGLVGSELAGRSDPEELARRIESGRLASDLAERGEIELLGGWLGAMHPFQGTRAVEDHRFWVYFARRFGLELVATLEPFPGIAPTTRHLASVVEVVREQRVPLILSTPYFDPSHARWVAERSGARVVSLAHQVGAREGTGDYLAVVDYNVRQLLEALADR